MINFELPEKLWKVTKTYLTNDLPQEYVIDVISREKSWYFKDSNLAQEFCDSFEPDDYEDVVLFTIDSEQIVFNLKVVAYLEQIDTINLIPKVVDL
jgi:hypothetical protein